ncbi:carboxymuconolactone decarboxylase family protein [Candidatus Roseilinea sp. NK_OTU-006]|uniref:carboxymuconolactone decarboxylase family protein n=1 Tax=Candidatus Roseilinea sp. NK_OTU-006 TaxID=2704250 RepID=UPI00145EDD39|nr:carboxymuconolactone decarboxylase family protein [Candidatus Roseilinea sp. NK_OTU-006]
MTKLPKTYQLFKKAQPKVWRAYARLGEAAAQSGPLDEKTRELIKLGMSAALRSESAVKSHVHRAREAGASPDEVTHAITLGVTTIGFPAMMTALYWAQEALQSDQRESG